jgi:poly-gamma-glutamate synthesis protein (capsule biosynthesis protein)
MEASLSIPMLKSLNVVAVSLANNHSRDLGEKAYQAMKALLASAGIRVLDNGTVNDLGPFRLAAFTDLDNTSRPGRAVLTDEDFAVLTLLPRDKPLFGFIHWGEEYSDHPSQRELDLAAGLQEKGVELVMGCHSHRPSHMKCTRTNCEVFSLGNFIFDQSHALNTGKLLEVAFFPQGTYSLRLHDIGNVYATLVKRPSSRRQGFSPGR